MAEIHPLTACRLCRSANLWTFFDLGLQPLANNLLRPEELDEPEFFAPLQVMRCDDCYHVQLAHTVPPSQLFGDYRFTSGTSKGWQDHCQWLVHDLATKYGHGFVVDIGSNDGTLLAKFKRLGWRTLGVDPARNLARAAPIKTEIALWGERTAQSLITEYGHADLIIAQNVFGHVDDPVDFLQGVRRMLKPHGICVLEVPDVRSLLKTHAFDTIYHEHLSYWSAVTVSKAASLARLVVRSSKQLKTHGGSLRFVLAHGGKTSAIHGERVVHDFKAITDRTRFETFQGEVDRLLAQIGEYCVAAPRPFWGYAASAKATVLLNALKARDIPLPEWVLDDTVGKQGYLIPGVQIPIVKPEVLENCRTLMLLAWNWSEGLQARAKHRGFKGQYLIPLPVPSLG